MSARLSPAPPGRRPPRRLPGALLVAALVTAFCGLLAGPAHAATGTRAAASAAPPPRFTGLGIRLLDAPVALLANPRAHFEIIDVLRPGTTIVREVGVTNDTGHPARILIYPDASVITGGQFLPGPGESTNELTSWMHVSPSVVTLAQGQAVTATVRIHVPANATNGERYAAILAELPPTPLGGGVAEASRVGIRVYLYVDDSGTPVTAFAIRSLTALRLPDGRPELRALVDDTGQRAVDLSGRLWLSDGPGGTSAGPFPVQLGTTLAPGQREPATVLLPRDLPDGPWLARLRLVSGLTVREAQARVRFPATPGRTAPAVRARPVPLTRAHPAVVAIAGALVAFLAVLLGLLWRRRRRQVLGPGAASRPRSAHEPRPTTRV